MFRLAWAVTACLVVGSLARADSPQKMLEDAARANAGGETERALEMWERIWKDHPGTPYAADALYLGAEANEERGEYDAAVEGYGRLTRDYPSHRLAPKAAQRISLLESSRIAGDEPLRTYRSILRRFYQSTPDHSIARMEQLAEENPGFPLRGQALLWIAERYREVGRFRPAVQAYDRYLTDYPEGDRRIDALEGKGMALVRLHRYGEAETVWNMMVGIDPTSVERRSALVERTRAHRFRRNLFFLGILPFQALCLLCVLVLTPWRTLRAAHFRSGLQAVVFVFPLLAAVYWVLSSRNAATAQGVFWMMVSLPTLLILNSVFVATGRIHAAFRHIYPVVAALFVVGVIYGILYALDLVFVFEQTWRGDVEWQ